MDFPFGRGTGQYLQILQNGGDAADLVAGAGILFLTASFGLDRRHLN
jgi:hypothetical protein